MSKYKSRYYDAVPSMEALVGLLALINIRAPVAVLILLSDGMTLRWADWAMEQHLIASDNVIRCKLSRPTSLLMKWGRP